MAWQAIVALAAATSATALGPLDINLLAAKMHLANLERSADQFAEPLDGSKYAGKAFVAEASFDDGNTYQHDPHAGGIFSYQDGRLRLSVGHDSMSRSGNGVELASRVAQTGKAYPAENGFGRKVSVMPMLRSETVIAADEYPTGEDSLASGSLEYIAGTTGGGPKLYYAVTLSASPDEARTLAMHARYHVEGVLARDPKAMGKCTSRVSSATVDHPYAVTISKCAIYARINRVRIFDSRNGKTLAVWEYVASTKSTDTTHNRISETLSPSPRGEPTSWVTGEDIEGPIGDARLTVDSEGRAVGCIDSATNRGDTKTCTLLIRRARFQTGQPGQYDWRARQ